MTNWKMIYAALRDAGHSPLKASQIVLDARRGDKLAKVWIEGLLGVKVA